MSSSSTARVHCTHTRSFLQNGQRILQELFLANFQYVETPMLAWDQLTSLQVASSSTIDLGVEDDPEMIREMIRSMYVRDDTLSYSVLPPDERSLSTLVDLFTLADKYDLPQLRQKISYAFKAKLSHDYSRNADEFVQTIIARVCGPTAIQPADKNLQRLVLEHCKMHFVDLLQDRRFLEQYAGGTLFDSKFALAYSLHLGKSTLESKSVVTTPLKDYEPKMEQSPERSVLESCRSNSDR